MKRMGRRHRPFYRLCAVDNRAARDGRVIEELGYYDPMVQETDARARLKGERIDYWLSVGAQPSDNVRVLIAKYGTNGTHLQQQAAALERLQASKPAAPPPVAIAKPQPEQPQPAAEAAPAEEGAAEEAAAEAPAEEAPAAQAEAPAERNEEGAGDGA